MRARHQLVFLAVVGGALACAPDEALSSRVAPIAFGEASGPEDDAVVYVMAKDSVISSGCTGTLIGHRVVLTARHCVSIKQDGTYQCALDGTVASLPAPVPTDAGRMGLVTAASNVAIRTGADAVSAEVAAVGQEIIYPPADTICRNDLALIVLDRPIDVEPEALHLGSIPLRGSTGIVVGYGQNEDSIVERRRRAGVPIWGVGDSTVTDGWGTAVIRTIAAGPGGCHGDSGGPLLAESGGGVIGVFSRMSDDCMATDARTVYTLVAPFREYIEEAMAAAGEEWTDLDAPSPSAGGAAATGGAQAVADAGAGTGGRPAGSEGGSGGGSGCSWTRAGGPSAGSWALLLCLFGGRLAVRRRRG